jgi:imidazolonepropionase-like amidohydrolase
MATGTNARLLALSGKRNPYPGKIGTIEEGAFADLLLVDGDPVADVSLLQRKDRLVAILKGGEIHKLDQAALERPRARAAE